MIKLENYEIQGINHAIRGMRNPMNSWEKSDSKYCGDFDTCDDCPFYDPDDNGCTIPESEYVCDPLVVGENDHKLMMKLAKGGSVHAKYRRMITVYVDITAPLYWWKEFDTYKVGTVANSCSTMHKIHEKEFTLEDFSCEHLRDGVLIAPNPNGFDENNMTASNPLNMLKLTITALNVYRRNFIEATEQKMSNAKHFWWQMIQLLPSSYNQKRTVMLNYEVLANIYRWRKDHKLDEWREFCEWIEKLPYSEVITGGTEE